MAQHISKRLLSPPTGILRVRYLHDWVFLDFLNLSGLSTLIQHFINSSEFSQYWFLWKFLLLGFCSGSCNSLNLPACSPTWGSVCLITSLTDPRKLINFQFVQLFTYQDGVVTSYVPDQKLEVSFVNFLIGLFIQY